MKQIKIAYQSRKTCILSLFLIVSMIISFSEAYAQASSKNNSKDQSLLDQYIKTKGPQTIVFDQSNIKQFWVDNSVISYQESFSILLNSKQDDNNESVPLKIQLSNVLGTQKCTIEVITECPDLSFSILKDSSNLLSNSSSLVLKPLVYPA